MIEVLTEKLFPKILWTLGKENPSKRRCKVAFVQRQCALTLLVSVRFLSLRTASQAKFSVCTQGSRECCPHSGTICLSLYGSPVRHQVLRDVTQHFNRPIGNLPCFKYRRVIKIEPQNPACARRETEKTVWPYTITLGLGVIRKCRYFSLTHLLEKRTHPL